MASFRTGFKIFGELSLKQGLGRIRSFSEDRKPGSWLPEDQWAVRPPGSTCPEPCDKPKKPPKPSKSWLSVCKDPEVPLECDVRHNNCPPPLAKPEGPWYSLDNLIPKKKHEKPPPLRSCREEMKRRELCGEEEEVANVKPYRNYKNGMDLRRKNEYANKVKCSTLKSAQPDPVGINEPRKIMLGLTNEDSICEYEQKPVVPKRKKPRQGDTTKVKSSSSSVKPPTPVEAPKSETAKEYEESSLLCQEPVTQNAIADEVAVSNVLKQNENSLSFLNNDPVPVDDNSKAFMGSLGSWINDFFSTPDNSKKMPSHASPKIESKPFQPVALPDEDSDYLKTINVLKEEFKKKLKSETSVHISNGDKLLQFNVNECGNKKLKKKLKSLHTVESLVKVAFTKDEKEPSKEDQFGVEVKRQGPNDLLNMFAGNKEKETSIQCYKAKNELDLMGSNLIKEKKKYKRKGRSNQRMLEEYVFPVPTDLSKRLLLNVDDQEKCSKLYKNSHVGIQENHNAQKSRRSYQNSTRCYTTNASLTENVEIIPFKTNGKNNVRLSQSSHSSVSSSGKRKTLGTRNNSTFVKVRSQRTTSSPHVDAAKIDSKNTSDDLVRYLMKKVKVQHRPPVAKKKSAGSFVQSSALTSGKSKFMQSATSSLVMNVLSKKDGDILLSTKGASRVSGGEKIDLVNMKPAYQTKGWNQKYDEAQARLDVKRVSTQNRLNKSTYLSDDHSDLDSNNLFFGKGSPRQLKKFSDTPFKTDSKKSNDKHSRKSEGKVTPVKLDKSNIYKMAKIKPKDFNKKSMPSTFLENYGNPDDKEHSSGKFQHQHELFKNSLKSVQQNGVDPESSTENDDGKTNEKELEATLGAVSPISSDLPGGAGFQLVPEESSDVGQCETVNYSAPVHDEVKTSGDDVLSCFSIDDSSLNMSVDKPTSSAKPKSLQLLKEENTSILLSPSDGEKGLTLANLTGLESSAGVCQDVRPVKPFDGAPLLNRKLSPNFSGETSKQRNASPVVNYKTFLISERDQYKENSDSGKRHSKDKKKEGLKKGNVDKGRDCGFEKTNKPGPNCENEISS